MSKHLTPSVQHIDNSILSTFAPVRAANALSEQTRHILLTSIPQAAQRGVAQSIHEVQGVTALYARLSSEDRNDGESNSIQNQKKLLEKYCKDNGIRQFQHYEDDGYSGTNFERPGFQKMLSKIKSGEIDQVVVKDMSRFGRDYLQVGMFTDMLFPQLGVHFVAISDGVDSKRGDNDVLPYR